MPFYLPFGEKQADALFVLRVVLAAFPICVIVRIALIGMVVLIGLMRRIVWVVLVGIVIQLLL